MKHILECGVIVLHFLEEHLLRELWVRQGVCVGLDVSLLEVVGVGLITCEEVGVVKRVHLLFGEVRSATTALKVVGEVHEGLQEVKDEWEDEEVEGNGGLNVEGEALITCVDEIAMRCSVWIMTTRTWLRNKRTAHSRVSVHVRCVEGYQGLGGHVVLGAVRYHHADVIPSTEFFPSGFCSSLLYL